MIELHKQPRSPRVSRTPRSTLGSSVLKGNGDENDHLWIVSYADLLMVLLCFFVLFFAQGKANRDTLIQRIFVHELKIPALNATSDAKATTSRGPGSLPPGGTIPSNLGELLKGLNLTTLQEGESLVLFFPDNVYAKGKSELPAEQRIVLQNLFQKLQPYQNEIDLIFIGHTDSTPVVHSRNRRIDDNFDLSSARAKEALTLARRFGYPSDRLRIQGDAASRRSSRTLSITLQEKGKSL